jgi:uncharacterized membrane protein YraQ (UPF0718 family)
MTFLSNLFELTMEASPWLLLGLLICGLIKAWMNESWLANQLGGNNFISILKAAIIGTPLPLCSCSVIPVAMGIRRSGASKSSTVSFLVATPETGADSIALSYAMLGPLMAIVRPVAAIFSAISSGLLVTVFDKNAPPAPQSSSESSCCSSKKSCCGDTSSEASDNNPKLVSQWQRISKGMKFAFTDIFDDFVVWLAIGLVFAALVRTFVPDSFLVEWGSGLMAMLVMMAVGIPMYICATASTPIAAALIAAGVSPGTALVFLLAGPATNMATLAVISRELGCKTLVLYLVGIGVTSILSGLLLDMTLTHLGIDVRSQLSAAEEVVPLWLAYASTAVILVLAGFTLHRKSLA